MSIFTARHCPAALPVLLACLLSPALSAQTSDQLDRMIFEPVLLDNPGAGPASGIVPGPAQAGDGMASSLSSTDTSSFTGTAEPAAATGDYLEAIAEIESEDGAYSNELFEALMSLGSEYQQQGNHDEAIEAFERAEHISRVNFGPFDPSQYASIEKAIDSYLAKGDLRTAMQYERYLLYLHEKYYGQGDMSTLPSVVRLANQNLDTFMTVINNPEPFLTVNISMGSGPSARAPSPRAMAFGNLYMAQNNYVKAILTMIENKAFFRPEILELEYKFLETLFLQANQWAILSEPNYYLSEKPSSVTGSLIISGFSTRDSRNYGSGKETFDRILIYLKNNPRTPPEAIASATIDLGDWHLLFGRSGTALRTYRQAFDLLQKAGVDEHIIHELFSPDIPVQLPLITSKPNSREKFGIPQDRELSRDGYVDVAFTINRYGKVRNLDIVGKSANTTPQIEKRMKRFLRNGPFRPRFSEGKPLRSDRLRLRYYYTYNDDNAGIPSTSYN